MQERNEGMALEEVSAKLSLQLPIETIEKIKAIKSVRILFTGRTGVGKSTLINSLVGKVVATEGDDLNPQTMEVQSYTTNLNNVDITVWDSPGLQDGTDNEESYIKQMSAKCGQGCDLVVYCIKMTENRFATDEIEAIKILTKAFGEDIWRNAVFVLTYANHVLQLAPKKDPQGYLQKRFDLFNKTILTKLKECGIKKEIVDSIPIIPVGHMDMAEDKSGGGPALLPLTNDWLSNFWFTLMIQMKETGQAGMIIANACRFKKEEDITAEDRKKPASEQHIACSKQDEEKLLRILGNTVGAGASAGSAAAVAGGVLATIFGGPFGLIAAIAAVSGGAAGGYLGYKATEK